jgi:hypothetical protein
MVITKDKPTNRKKGDPNTDLEAQDETPSAKGIDTL